MPPAKPETPLNPGYFRPVVGRLTREAGPTPTRNHIIGAIVRCEAGLDTVRIQDLRDAFGISAAEAKLLRAEAAHALKLEAIDKPGLAHWSVIRLQAIADNAMGESRHGKAHERINWSRLAVSSLSKLLDYASMSNLEQEHWDSLSKAEKLDRLEQAQYRLDSMREAMGQPEVRGLLPHEELEGKLDE